MRPCSEWQKILDGDSFMDRTVISERHLAECPRCSDAVREWRRIRSELGAMGARGAESVPLFEEAPSRRTVGWRLRPVAGVLIATAAAALLLVVYAALRPADRDEGAVARAGAPGPADQSGGSTEEKAGAFSIATVTDPTSTGAENGRLLEAPADCNLKEILGAARIALSAGGRARIAAEGGSRTAIVLEAGRIACEVEPRTAGGRFSVEARGLLVEVTGTVFEVDASGDGLVVRVERGEVRVERLGERPWSVSAGNALVAAANGVTIRPLELMERGDLRALLNGAAGAHVAARGRSSAGTAVPQEPEPSLSTVELLADWTERVTRGECSGVEDELVARVGEVPEDTSAWNLLATCQRRAGRFVEALASYEQIANRARGAEANLARYRCGVLLQEKLGRYSDAAEYYHAYLAASGVDNLIEAEAMVRLAESLLVIGREGEAKEVLARVVAEHGDAPIATKARRMLSELGVESRLEAR
jgi:ferric-dicitrate binding protein FerR (iron transport regulator)